MTRPNYLAKLTSFKPTLCYTLVLIISYCYLDKPLAQYFHDRNLEQAFLPLTWLTHLGEIAIYTIGLFFMALLFRYRHQPLWEARCWFLWVYMVFSNTLCLILKISLGRARPILWFEHQWYGFYGMQASPNFWSCPSGHTTCIMAWAIGLSFIFPRYAKMCIVGGLMVASSRILLVHHFLSDVLSALYLTLITLRILVIIMQQQSLENHPFTRWIPWPLWRKILGA